MANRLIALLVALLLPAADALAQQEDDAAPPDPPPNIVVFIADDLGYDDLPVYGNDAVQTPRIARLADEGLTFDKAFLVISSCTPSRVAILTGRYPHTTSAPDLHANLDADETLLFTPLRDAGYWTIHGGKWHLGNAVKDQVDDFWNIRWNNPGEVGQRWVDQLQRRPKDPPFFFWAATSDPHYPHPQGAPQRHDPADVKVPPVYPDTEPTRRALARYYDEIARFDDHVGMVLDELAAQGVLDETLVLVMSDNGRPFPQAKTRLNNPGIHTPLIARLPGTIPRRPTHRRPRQQRRPRPHAARSRRRRADRGPAGLQLRRRPRRPERRRPGARLRRAQLARHPRLRARRHH